MKLFSLACVLVFVGFFVAGCTSVKISDYSKNTPVLIPHEFFNGNLTAQGVVKNRSGKVIRHFNATIKAYWQEGVGTLEEKFIFNDGEVQYRTWTLVADKKNAKSLLATAGDVVGIGSGQFAGNALNLAYVLNVKYNDSTINVSVDDWMWLVDEKTLLNESTLTKFGFKVGSVQLVILKH